MSRETVTAEIERLEEMSRLRALDDRETWRLSKLTSTERRYDYAQRRWRSSTEKPGAVPATPPGSQISDASSAATVDASAARPIGPLRSGLSTALEAGA